jgi:hypothetical protein
VLIDDYTQFFGHFPYTTNLMCIVLVHIVDFVAYTHTQFSTMLADNGIEFINNATTSFLTSHDITLRLSCPYTFPQNSKTECMLLTNSNTIHTLLIHALMHRSY